MPPEPTTSRPDASPRQPRTRRERRTNAIQRAARTTGARSYSAAKIERELNLATAEAQTVAEQVLRRFIEDTYTIEVVGAMLSGDAKEIDTVLDGLDKVIAEVETAFSANADKYRAMAEKAKIEPLSNYSSPVETTFIATTPQAVKFLDLLESLDTTGRTVDALRFAGKLGASERNNVKHEGKLALMKLANTAGSYARALRGVAARRAESEGTDTLATDKAA